MNTDQWIRELNEGGSDEIRIRAVDRLQPLVDDRLVLTSLCCAALKTDSARLRQRLIAALQPAANDANRLFKQAAEFSVSALVRRRAFINLSLMGCRTAMQTVIDGLADADRRVQKAAALSIGLYQDQEFITAVDDFFEKNRLLFAEEGIRQLYAHIASGLRFRLGNCFPDSPVELTGAP